MFQFANPGLQQQPQAPKDAPHFQQMNAQGLFGSQTTAAGDLGDVQALPQGDQHRLDGPSQRLPLEGNYGRPALLSAQDVEMQHLQTGMGFVFFGACAYVVRVASISYTVGDMCLGFAFPDLAQAPSTGAQGAAQISNLFLQLDVLCAGYVEGPRGMKRQVDAAPETASPSVEPVKRSRLVWTTELHQRFEEAVEKAGGIDVAVPKTVLEVRLCYASGPV
jgi:hypothetical protein